MFPLVYIFTPFTALIQDPIARYTVFLFIMLTKGIVVIIAFPVSVPPSAAPFSPISGFRGELRQEQ